MNQNLTPGRSTVLNQVSCPHCGKNVELKGFKPLPFWRQEIGCGTLLLVVLVWSLISDRHMPSEIDKLHRKVDTLTEQITSLQSQQPLPATEADTAGQDTTK